MWKLIPLLLISACASVIPSIPPIIYTPIPSEKHAWAYVDCSYFFDFNLRDILAAPVYIVADSAAMGPENTKFILVHEMKHVEQFQRKGGCLQGKKYYDSSDKVRLQWEIEANCASLVARHLSTWEYERLLIDDISIYYRAERFPKISYALLTAEFFKVCEKEKRKLEKGERSLEDIQ